MLKKAFLVICITTALFFCSLGNLVPAKAEMPSSSMPITGSVYEFDSQDSKYEYGSEEPLKNPESSGSLSISGIFKLSSRSNGFQAFEVQDGTIQFSYSGSDSLYSDDAGWKISDDSCKSIDSITLDDEIGSGVVLVETSVDGKKWVISSEEEDAFSEESKVKKDNFYRTDDVQLANGRYYRVTIAFQTRRQTGKKNFLVLNEYEYKKHIEVYQFYLQYSEKRAATVTKISDEPFTVFEERMEYDPKSSYTKSIDITASDPHSGWKIGRFIINGYTADSTNKDGNRVFLKTVGDSVTMWFQLDQDINNLNNNPLLTIANQKKNNDQNFETPVMAFKHGILLIRFTDTTGHTGETIKYTDFLAANGTKNANTKVVLNEEGAYEVSLDYEIEDKREKIGPVTKTNRRDYAIRFSFEVRNGNNQVFLFDLSGSELMNKSITKNGFRVDLANSKSVEVSIKRSVLNNSSNELDQRYDKPVSDGDEFTEEGLYEITIHNNFTDAEDTKEIYVGDNKLMKAFMVTGYSIKDIKQMINDGWTINDDGTMNEPVMTSENTSLCTVSELIGA